MAYLREDDALWQALSSVVEDEGFCLYDVERVGSSGIRLSIDVPQRDLGVDRSAKNVSSGDCSKVCKRLVVFFSVEASRFGLGEAPQIEVSSPGINRALRLPRHFSQAVGERIKVVLEAGANKGSKSSTVVGRLEVFKDDLLQVIDEQTSEKVELALREVKRASVHFDFS